MDKPTGARPKPSLPKMASAKGAGQMNKVRPSPKHTSMSASKRAATSKDTSKRRGL